MYTFLKKSKKISNKELKSAIVQFMWEALAFFPNGWGDLQISNTYDNLIIAWNKVEEENNNVIKESFSIFN